MHDHKDSAVPPTDEKFDPTKLEGYGGWLVSTVEPYQVMQCGRIFISASVKNGKLKVAICSPIDYHIDRKASR